MEFGVAEWRKCAERSGVSRPSVRSSCYSENPVLFLNPEIVEETSPSSGDPPNVDMPLLFVPHANFIQVRFHLFLFVLQPDRPIPSAKPSSQREEIMVCAKVLKIISLEHELEAACLT